ncbi:MAG: rhomboid family intramembrane serine protease [Candidatus Omnitrophota bacterium]
MTSEMVYHCPECQIELSSLNHEGNLFWFCPQCGGGAVNMSVLRKRLEKGTVNYFWKKALNGEGTEKRSCPACGQKMLEVDSSSRSELPLLDVCVPCQFVWFDAGEYEKFPLMPWRPLQSHKLPKDAAIAFGKVCAEHLKEIDQRSFWESDDGPSSSMKSAISLLLGLPVKMEEDARITVPWFTWGLLAAIAIASVLAFQNFNSSLQHFALYPNQARRMAGLTFLTSFFLHSGIVHLLGNLYFFNMLGPDVEDFLGKSRYLLFLLFAILAGGMEHVLFDPHPDIPCIGASGGISGIMVFYALKFHDRKFGFVFRYPLTFNWIWLKFPACIVFLPWIGYQLILAQWHIAGVSNASALAQLGGAAAGLIGWMLWKDLDKKKQFVNSLTKQY